jgi:hypothetical protein
MCGISRRTLFEANRSQTYLHASDQRKMKRGEIDLRIWHRLFWLNETKLDYFCRNKELDIYMKDLTAFERIQ